jgi:uncharacterized protein (DUF2384 family)
VNRNEVEALAITVFGDPIKAHNWLQSWNDVLQARPVDLLDTEADLERVAKAMTAIEQGLPC